jgi:predicted O-linked N-acetylglucosamine transferase (SPINDLY family)
MEKEQLKEKISDLKSKISNESLSASEIKQNNIQLIVYYDKLIEIDPEDYFAYLEKATTFMYSLNDFQKAALTIETAVEKLGYDKVMFLRLSDSYQKLGRFSDALKALDEVIQKEFFSDYFYAQRAILNRKLGNISEAEKDQKIYDDYEAREKAKWDDPNHYYHYK